MSRTEHSRWGHAGKEWWGKRPLAGIPVSRTAGENKWWKRLLHKIERRISKKRIEEDYDNG